MNLNQQSNENQPLKNEFTMNVERVDHKKYIITFNVVDTVYTIQGDLTTKYYTCSNPSGNHVYSNLELGNCFEHLYQTEKLSWAKRNGFQSHS